MESQYGSLDRKSTESPFSKHPSDSLYYERKYASDASSPSQYSSIERKINDGRVISGDKGLADGYHSPVHSMTMLPKSPTQQQSYSRCQSDQCSRYTEDKSYSSPEPPRYYSPTNDRLVDEHIDDSIVLPYVNSQTAGSPLLH